MFWLTQTERALLLEILSKNCSVQRDIFIVLKLFRIITIIIIDYKWNHLILLLCTSSSIVDPSISCFEPEAAGVLVKGLDFHKFFFDHREFSPISFVSVVQQSSKSLSCWINCIFNRPQRTYHPFYPPDTIYTTGKPDASKMKTIINSPEVRVLGDTAIMTYIRVLQYLS